MPLLRKKTLERANDVLDLLKDDDEVFYCEITNELFRNYEEYCERIILVNSMVWSCSMTGKSNLTYAEALQSEQDAASSLKKFPEELRAPIIYLASQTKRRNLKDMLEDVFLYAKDNFFIGEKVQVYVNDDWIDAEVMLVKESTKKATKNDPGPNYTYNLKLLPMAPNSKTLNFKPTHIQRKRGSYTRAKNKLFLKQYVEQADGIFRIKDAIIKKFGIDKMKLSDFFIGLEPDFAMKSKVFETGSGSKVQSSIAKFLMKTEGDKINSQNGPKKMMNGDVKSLKNKPFALKKSSDDLKQKIINDKKAMKERRRMEKMSSKDMELRVLKFIRQWHQLKEDLELTDHKVLPTPSVIDTFISNKKFGEFICILEFLETFSEELNLKESFPHGVTWDILERALTLKEINGPLHDIFQLLLLYIFNILSEEYSSHHNSFRPPQPKYPLPETGTLAWQVENATAALRFANSQFATTLVNKQVDAVTLSEILRLHLLASGSRVQDSLGRYRSNNRGGYDSTDDPGLQLRISQPHILKALSMYNICQLPQSDILKLLTCLMNQILTYSPIRELVERRIEQSTKAKLDLRTLQATHRKTIIDYTAKKQTITTESTNERETQKQLDAVEKEHSIYLKTYMEQYDELLRIQFSHEVYLGSDRCHRRYWLFESVAGLFVEDNETQAGSCLQNIVLQHPELSTCESDKYDSHLRTLYRKQYVQKIHDKENTDVSMVTKNDTNTLDRDMLHDKAEELLMCTADDKTCKIHGSTNKVHWSFYHTKEEIDALIASLNKRGVREGPLLINLKQWKHLICDHVEQCPVERLNKNMKGNFNLRPKMKYHENDTNLNHEPGTDASIILRDTLVEFILELHEKISTGCLGKLQVEDVECWQEALRSGDYEMQCEELNWGVCSNGKVKMYVKKKSGEILTIYHDASKNIVKEEQKDKDKEQDDEAASGDDDDDDLENVFASTEQQFYDPGHCLGPTVDIESEDSDDSEFFALHESSEQKENLHNLACALLQVAQSVNSKNLQTPFGPYSIKTGQYSDSGFMKSNNRYRKWEISLMNSTSYAQIFSHYHAFEQSIIWSNSVQYASCKICKRKARPEQMLLCDKCNCAIHMYCVKPEIKVIPEGDWYCDTCKPTEKEKTSKNNRRRNNRVIKEEYEDSEGEPVKKRSKKSPVVQENGHDSGLDESKEMLNGHAEDKSKVKSNKRTSSTDTLRLDAVCNTCKSGGIMVACETCQLSWHIECIVPALRRAPRGKWVCAKCNKKSRKEQESNTDSELEETPVRKSRRTNDTSLIAEEPASFSIPNGQEFENLLREIGKHRDSWPFMAPVTLEEVPDYFDIIKNPMDFGTITSKLKSGEYSSDSEIADDIALVFQNCDTYNNGDSDVFKAGGRLLKFILKRGQEFNFDLPESIKEGFIG